MSEKVASVEVEKMWLELCSILGLPLITPMPEAEPVVSLSDDDIDTMLAVLKDNA